MEEKQKALSDYVKEKHTQEECIGFIAGYEVLEQRVKVLEEYNKFLLGVVNERDTVIFQVEAKCIELEEENKKLTEFVTESISQANIHNSEIWELKEEIEKLKEEHGNMMTMAYMAGRKDAERDKQ